MKIYIGPYKGYFGPYQLAELLCFWSKPVKDEYGIPRKPDWVHKFGEFLAYGNIQKEKDVGEEYSLFDNDERSVTFLYRFLIWANSKKKRKINIHIDEYDIWDMYVTLGHIIRPMLAKIKESKCGSPFVDDEDVPENLRRGAAPELSQEEKDTGHVDENHEARWVWVLDEMIFAFDSIEGGPNQDWEDQFTTGKYDFKIKKIAEDGTGELVHGENHTAKTDWEARKKYGNRIQNGLRIFGKYYQSLWT